MDLDSTLAYFDTHELSTQSVRAVAGSNIDTCCSRAALL